MIDYDELVEYSQNMKILYVEDNKETRESILRLLQIFFINITTAVDGEDGLEKFKDSSFDLIITDINMPNMNGLDMIKEIREINIDIPILILSAYNETNYFTQSIRLGVDGYILKPIETSQFTDILSKIIKKLKLNQESTKNLLFLQQYEDIANNSSIVSKTNPEGIITFVNDAFCKISGYKEYELIGHSYELIRHLDNSSEIYKDMWNTIKNKKQIWKGILRNRSKDGISYYVKTAIKPMLNHNGTILEYIALQDDVSEIFYQKRQLEHSMQIITENVLFSKTNLQGDIAEVSDSFCELSGYSRDELLGKPHNIVRHPDMPQSAFKDLWDTTKEDKIWSGEVKNLKKCGGYYWFIAHISPVFNPHGDKIGYIAIRTDITAQKQYEEERKKLIQSEKLASMGELIGNIAHQWRQPLSVISTAASGMIMEKEFNILSDEKFYSNCKSINEHAQYLSRTIDDFRDFIQEDSKEKRFNLKDSIDSFLHLIDSAIKYYHINLILNVENNIFINGYENELIQCFVNIFNNAKDALNENNIEDKLIFITIELKGDKVIIKFKDNAKGIAEDILPKIFDPYFTTKHQSQGTGLGLNIIYKLITEGMKGTIEANNTEYIYKNQQYIGVEFVISLPIS